MVKVTVEMDEKVVREFKGEVVRRKGKLRGAMGEAMEEAMELWIKKQERQ